MGAAVEGAAVTVARAFEIETRYFVDLVCNSVHATNMTQAFFFDLQTINRGGSRPDGYERSTVRRVAVLGAGLIGAGIAYQCAKSGIEVALEDVDLAGEEKGKAYSHELVAKGVQRGKVTQEQGQALLDRITPTADVGDLTGCGLVIEAGFESTDLEHRVFAETEPVVAPDASLCSNTSTLPITTLATGVERPQDFIGLHFFSPVDMMPLVEIIRGEQTSDAALARAVDLVQQIGETPIVGPASAADGRADPDPAAQDRGRVPGRRTGRRGLRATPAYLVLDRMVEEFDRPGRSGGGGSYDSAVSTRA